MNASKNFPFSELLYSSQAHKLGQEVVKQQENPPQEIIENIKYVARATAQPARDYFGCVINASGYRCKTVNDAVGSTDASQHLQGEALDLTIVSLALNKKHEISQWVFEKTRKHLHDRVSANGLLFLYLAFNLERFDIDQLIHEFGVNGAPGWVHVSASKRANRRQIMFAKITNRKNKIYEVVDFEIMLERFV